ncbi:zinc finger MYM-type 1-like [Paramuricea clavata]|uniref:Zinc finger MYM-type 1-like n=1 Tax=Paramuricea clavata TaxID=317549 RepID=A0A6S7JV48_PARCT|nr:zinc finger MYM-type 1-like [Paramuricea clavata]
MKTYDFFFGLNLGEWLFSHTDNLSKTLQSTKMCAASGQRLANLTKEVLQKIRSDESFILYYEAILIKSKNIPSISEPTLPRKRRAPARFEIGTGMPSYPTTSQDYYRQIYFECIDFMINAIEQRFNQPSFSVYEQMESFLLKVLNDQDYSTELQFLEDNYSGDLDIGALKSQLEIFKLLLKDADCVCFYDMLVKIRELPEPEKKMISHIITICKLIQVNPATSASAERSFSAARRLKTWLRSTMSQERLNNLTVINEHKERTDGLCLVDIANEFCERNENRKRNFGRFVESDCYQHSNICAICQKEALECLTGATTTQVHVIKGNFGCLLSYQTASALGLIMLNVNNVKPEHATHEQLMKEYAHLFNGIGTIKNFEVKLHIDDTVPPVAQTPRRIPFHMRQKVSDALDTLESDGVIEKVSDACILYRTSEVFTRMLIGFAKE